MSILKRLKANERGFFLLELCIVLATIALLILIATPVYSGITEKAQATAYDLQVRYLRQVAELYLLDGGADTVGAPEAGEMARREINASHDAWGNYLEQWPENPLGSGEFVVKIEGWDISIMPGRG